MGQVSGYKINRIRILLLFSFFIVMYIIGIINLFIIQIKNSYFFSEIGKKQYITSIKKTPPRAQIFDRNNRPLAINKEVFSLFIIPKNLKEKSKVRKILKNYFPGAYRKLQNRLNSNFMYVKRHLSKDELELVKGLEMEDLNLLKEVSRFYLLKSLGHTIGITDTDNRGIAGIELIRNKELRGIATEYTIEKEARSNYCYFKKETSVKGVDGKSVQLTIDSDLQFISYDALKKHVNKLGAKEGAVLIMNPTNGDILSMAVYPDFDPNKRTPSDLSLTKNKIITEVYEFGSVMKVVLALAAIDEGVVRPDEIINCENRKEITLNRIKFSTWKAHGNLSFTDVIRCSNNIGTSKVALRLQKKLYHHFIKCGFTKFTGLPFPGEQKGYITPLAKWSLASPLSLSFGYEISGTILQLAQAFSIIANNGFIVTPRLIIDNKNSIIKKKLVYKTETIEKIRKILLLDHDGTSARLGKIDGYNVMGKTGTAKILSNGRYDNNKSIYTFAAIIEKDDYKRSIITFIKEPKKRNRELWASTVAVPLFKTIAESMLIHDKVI